MTQWNCKRDGHKLVGGVCSACGWVPPTDDEQLALFPRGRQEAEVQTTSTGRRKVRPRKVDLAAHECPSCGAHFYIATASGKCGLCEANGR